MALNMRGLFRLNLNLTNCIIFKPNILSVGLRSLYTERDLGVTLYENSRYVFRNQFMTIENTFREKMHDACKSNDGVIYTEDLKAMLHLAKDTDEDLKLVKDMLEKYMLHKEDRSISTYVFGPVLMRMYYHLNLPKEALEAYENEKLTDIKNYNTTLRILMCLLYKHNMYREMRDIFSRLIETKGSTYPGSVYFLIFAACFKENTKESYEFALNAWKEGMGVNSQRCLTLLAYFAIKNDAAETALEILSAARKEKIATVVNLKILAYMKMKKYLQVVPLLKGMIEYEDDRYKDKRFFSDVMYELEEDLATAPELEREELTSLIRRIKQSNSLELSTTLREYLLKPVNSSSRRLQSRFERSNRKNFRTTNAAAHRYHDFNTN